MTVCTPLSAPPLGDPMEDRYRLGRHAVKWIQRHCVYGQGAKVGQRVRLEKFQVRFILHLYELKPDGSRRYRRALLEIPKGNGKTPLSAWIGLYELFHTPAAEVVVAAASYKQAGLLYGDLKYCAQESRTLSSALSAFDAETQLKGTLSKVVRVAAVAGSNDGKRPSAFLADEIHEWLDNKAEVHGTIERGVKKRYDDGGFTLNTTTPGADIDSLAGQLHEYGLKVNAGEVVDRDGFLFVWFGCPEDRYDLGERLQRDDPEAFYANLCDAVRDANPAADLFLNVDGVAAAFPTMTRNKFLRYHLGLWTQVMEAWLPAGAFEARADAEQVIPDGADVVIAVDGSYNNDATAIVVASVGPRPHLEVGGLWERPDDAPDDWTVPVLEVESRCRELAEKYNVVECVFDPFRFKHSMEVLAQPDDLTGAPALEVVAYPQTPSRMVPATERFYAATTNGFFTHDGNPTLIRHVANCRIRNTRQGQVLTKEHKKSSRKIDLAVTAVMALDRASTPEAEVGANVW